ncbi:type II toxin-antitoxin system HipA family toxin [Janthinobacterium lividum]|uniref:type II toxin-antitoxin system HipA family toxin n=1 Tax=Janthinobacterium lividum TaxID=29581 RepID=UPI001594E9B8|nr:HipA domain-containing protein [Janthinobacterium lividum]QKY11981.1 type II toxin-antitoxin system HipA family toxin [Janthinobacterium lividum]
MSNELRPRYLEVWLHGQHIGWLCEAGRVTRFIATEQYLADTQRATLSISMTLPGAEQLTQETLKNHFDPAVYRERGELPPFFAGLMPEGALRRRLAATRKSDLDMDDFGILAAAGEDLPGAVTVVPANLDNLTAAARAYGVTGGADNLEISVPERAAEGAASLSGVQDKLALSHAKDGTRYCMPVRGKLSDLIAKLPLAGDDSQVMNEHACMALAGMAGVNVAQCRPAPMSAMADHPDLVAALGSETRFLAVDRFDRGPRSAVHMEDACQLLTLMPGQKYSGAKEFVKLIQVLDRLSTRGIEDVRQFFIRQTVNTLIGNSDAHLKNFSVLYHNGIRPELSPAYDIVCVSALASFRGFGTNVAIDQLQRQETLDTYATIAKRAGISERIAKAAVTQTVTRAKDLWPKALQDMDVPDAVRCEIQHRLNTLPLAGGVKP